VLLGIGALTGVLAMLLHSFTDFNMHNGADSLYFFFLCGLLIAAVNGRFIGYEARSLLPRQKPQKTPVYVVVSLFFVTVTAIVQYRTVAADATFERVKDIYVSTQLRDEKKQQLLNATSRAEALDPLDGRYSSKLAYLAWSERNIDLARQKYLAVVRKNPMTGDALQWLGLMAEDDGLARMLVEEGYRRAINRDELALTYAGFLLYKGDRQKAIAVMAEESVRQLRSLGRWAPMMESYSFTPDEIQQVLPPTPEGWIAYGDYLQKTGDLAGAEYYRSQALTHIDAAAEFRAGWYQQLIRFYHTIGKPERAQLVLREAVERLPDNVSFHVQLGDYFRGEGITFRAEEEYQRALMLDPANSAARRGLRKLGLLDAY